MEGGISVLTSLGKEGAAVVLGIEGLSSSSVMTTGGGIVVGDVSLAFDSVVTSKSAVVGAAWVVGFEVLSNSSVMITGGGVVSFPADSEVTGKSAVVGAAVVSGLEGLSDSSVTTTRGSFVIVFFTIGSGPRPNWSSVITTGGGLVILEAVVNFIVTFGTSVV